MKYAYQLISSYKLKCHFGSSRPEQHFNLNLILVKPWFKNMAFGQSIDIFSYIYGQSKYKNIGSSRPSENLIQFSL